MSTTLTKREAEIAREAFIAGAKWGDVRMFNYGELDSEATERYPAPKITRPRVVEDSDGDKWRWSPEMGLEWLCGQEWKTADARYIVDSCRAVVADLLVNPTEEVEAE